MSSATNPHSTRGDARPHPKPSKPYRATPGEWRFILRPWFEGHTCVACPLPFQHLHHIAFRRADSGDDVRENLAPICFIHHDLYHSKGPGWEHVAGAIRAYVMRDTARRNYAERKLGSRFNTRYPCPPNTDPQFQSDFEAIYGEKP